MKMSLMKKLSLYFLFVILGSILLVSLISNYLISKEFNNYLMDEHRLKIGNVVSTLEEQYKSQDSFLGINKKEVQSYAEAQGLYIEVKDLDGNSILTTGDSLSKHNKLMESMMNSMMHDFTGMHIGEYIENTYELKSSDKIVGSIVIGYYGTSYLSSASITFIRTLNFSLVLSALIALGFGFMLSVIISKQISSPIVKITETSNKMRAGNLQVKAAIHTNTKEIDELSDSINYLAETLNSQEMLRKRLTSDIAHELRTPLATLKTHVEAFMDGIWEPTNERFEIFYEEIERLTKLVDNLRNLAKLEQTAISLKVSEMDVSGELEKIIETYKPLFMKSDYELISDIAPSITATLDKDKFKQIINNLLSNAFHYLKPNGQVMVTLAVQGQMLKISVQDNGIGIPEKDLPYIFERFYRSDISRAKNTGGSGIGLTIVKAFVEAHGGKIHVDSTENIGTCFVIELPRQQHSLQ